MITSVSLLYKRSVRNDCLCTIEGFEGALATEEGLLGSVQLYPLLYILYQEMFIYVNGFGQGMASVHALRLFQLLDIVDCALRQ